VAEFLPPPDVARFPELAQQHLCLVGTDIPLGRIYWAGGSFSLPWNGFRWFGPTTSRFDHHPDPAEVHTGFGVMYLAPALMDPHGRPMSSLQTALLECFRDSGVVDAVADDPYFVLFKATRELRLLDLADSDWVTVAGGNAAISSGPRAPSRLWARAIYSRYVDDDALDGVIYTTSNLPASRSIALWERASDALPTRPMFNEQLRHLGLRSSLETFAHDVGLGLVV
jgi:hypothetical protein